MTPGRGPTRPRSRCGIRADIGGVPGAPLPFKPGCRVDLPRPAVAAPVEIAALLADPTRAGILKLLAEGPCCVGEMAVVLGERRNNVSNHLARLRGAGLVRPIHHAADGRWVYYELDRAACAAALAILGDLLDGDWARDAMSPGRGRRRASSARSPAR